jgi:hypothetical protein
MSLGDHMRLFDEEVDRLAEAAHRIDEELIRIEFNKPLRDRERPSRWPGAYISGYPRHRFQPNMGELKAGASSEWHAAWLGEVEERFDQSPLLRPLLQQYAERLAAIEAMLNMGLHLVSQQLEWSPPPLQSVPQAVNELSSVRHPLHGRPVERRSVHPSPGVEPPAASDSDPLAFKSLAELDQAAAIEKDTD